MSGSSLSENYSGVFDGSLRPGKKAALLIVDVVQAYLTDDSPLFAPTAQAALESNIRLADAARKAGIQILFTNVEFQSGGADGGVFYRKVPALSHFDKGSPLGAFPPTLQPADSDLIITKKYASAFFGTHLAATLTAMGVDTLFITGYSTSGCVRASGLDALQSGFIPLVVRDACADRHDAPHEANLFDLQAKYAEVITEKRALELIPSLIGS